MNAIIRKEIRLILWPFIAALVLAVVPGWLAAVRTAPLWEHGRPIHEIVTEVYIFCFTLGVLLLALTSFGQEFDLRTFTLTLAQPIERKALWRLKTTILGGAILLTVAALTISLHLLRVSQPVVLPFENSFWSIVATTCLIGVAAYSGGLCMSLLFRNFLMSLAVSALLPAVLLVCFSEKLFGVHATNPIGVAASLLGTYSILAFIFARWQFLRAEDAMSAGEEISISRGRFQPWAVVGSFTRTNSYLALIRKELQMQQVAFVVAAILLVCHLASFPVLAFCGEPAWIAGHTGKNLLATFVSFIFILWMALPLLIGGTAIADERRLGTHQMLLTLPVSRRVQLLTKLFVTLVLSFVLGGIMPFVLEHLAARFHLRTMVFDIDDFRLFAITSLSLGLIAFFSSTNARGSLDAFCLSIVATPLVVAAVAWFGSGNSVGNLPHYGILTPYIAAIFIGPTLLWLIWKNFQLLQIRWTVIVGSWLALGVSVLATCGACSFIWYRGWERFIAIEPKHGAPILKVGDHAKIASAVHGPVVLLPDGRIWTAKYKIDFVQTGAPTHRHEIATSVTLDDAHILPGTWIDIAATEEPYAIKSDGTLWSVRPVESSTGSPYQLLGEVAQMERAIGRVQVPPVKRWRTLPPRQIGTDTNWASLTGTGTCVLALKRDGSLWGWGINYSGELGPGPVQGSKHPIPVWPDTHWKKVFASTYFCLGIQEDGTTWQWGNERSYARQTIPDYGLKPTQFTGSNWTSFCATYPVHFATRDDRSLWTAIPKDRVDTIRPPWTIFGQQITTGPGLHQVGDTHDWYTLTSTSPLAALKTDGTWFVHDGESVGRRGQEGLKVSKYSDWVAIDSSFVTLTGLAADGTVSCWMRLDPYPYITGPSRGPSWSTNIFAAR